MFRNRIFYGLIVLLSLLFAKSANATHLVGGFISYEYVGTSSFGARYTITITSYRDCKPGSIPFEPYIDVCVFQISDNRLYKSYNFVRQSVGKVKPIGRTDCPEATQVCLEKAVYQRQIDLPTSAFGYFVKWEVCCRNTQVNLRDGQGGTPYIGQTYQTIIPPTNVKNSTAFFTETPVPFICINDTTELNNYAVDPDGDSLVYKLATPWDGASSATNYPGCGPVYSPPVPIDPADYQLGYNGNIPFGANGLCKINPSNGVATVFAQQVGNYAVAIDLYEYRNGVQLSVTRLDLQILVINCGVNTKPSISTTSKKYTIFAGDKLCFNVTGKDKDNQNLSLDGFGDLLTGANGFVGNKATFASASGNSSVSSQFCWQTSCNQARNTPYIFTARVIDDGCPSKYNLVNIEIKVKPFTGKATLTGPNTACEGAKGLVYTISTSADSLPELAGISHQVVITNGVLVSQSLNQIVVNWNRGIAQGEITIQAVSKFGCLGAPFTYKVNLVPSPAKPIVKNIDTVCENSSVNYSTVLTNGYTYQWFVLNGSIFGSSNSNSVSVVWGAPGKAAAYLVHFNQNGCPSDTAVIDVWISKPAVPGIIGKQSICPNAKGLIYTVATASNGSSFKWFVAGGAIYGSSNSNSITINWGNPGLGYVKVIETNRFGCPSDTGYYPVSKSYNLNAEFIEGDTDVCEYTKAQIFTVIYAPNTTYNWTVTGGTLISGQGTNSILIDWGISGLGSLGMYQTSYDSVNQKACVSNLVSRAVNIRAYPTANKINGVLEVCQYSSSGVYSVNGLPNSRYVWMVNGDTSNINGQGTKSILFDYSKEGTFNLEVIETSEYGCSGPNLKLQVIVHPKPRTSPILGDSIICSPNLLNYNYSVTGFNTSKFYWTVSGGLPQAINNLPNITIDWNGQQYNKLKVVEVSDFGCVGDTVRLDVFYDNPYLYLNYITVNPPPGADDGVDVYWSLRNAPKYNNQFFIEKRAAGSAGIFNTVGTVNGSAVTFNDFNTMNDSNAWEYRVKGFDLCGKPFYTSVHTNILLKGQKLGGYDISMKYTPYLGWGSSTIKYDLYRYLKNTGQYELFEPNMNTFNLSYSNGLEYYTQCYRVKGTKLGTDTVTWSNEVCFNFDPVIFIPNAFSPNDDDFNDAFAVKGGALKSVELFIYNRWGENLFVGKSINDTWDGTYMGKAQAQDVYMYYCYYFGFDGRKYSTKGTITLLR